jgi:hypothetical protein
MNDSARSWLGIAFIGFFTACPREGREDGGGVTDGGTETGDEGGDDDGDEVGEPTCPASVMGKYEVHAETMFAPQSYGSSDLDVMCQAAEEAFNWTWMDVVWKNKPIDGFEVRVDVSAYARLVAPDIYEVVRPDVVVFECPVSHFLQTVTIPLAEVLCDIFPPEHLRELRFVFDRTGGPKSRAVLLDTIEFQRDRSGQPLCD